MSDLFASDSAHRSNGKPRMVGTYDYCDEFGALLFQCVRFDPKDFRQRRPHPEKQGKWIWNLNGIRRVLYRLPELKAALASRLSIYVVEGEKDCDALRKAGLTATCNPMGAGKWLPEHTGTLHGASAVIVIADKDRPGRAHAQAVASALRGVVESLKLIELPDRATKQIKDAHDFLSGGGTAAELKEIAMKTPEYRADDIQENRSPTPENESEPILILPSGKVSISQAAKEIFRRMAKTQRIFWRGGAIAELVEKEAEAHLEILRPEGFRSRAERHGQLFAWRSGARGEEVLKPSKMSQDDACAIMASAEARELLPPIKSVLRCPVIMEASDSQTRILGRGYHSELGGILIVAGEATPIVELSEAVAALRELIAEFQFQSEGDRSRALAALITPALRMGGFLNCNVPIDVAEANDSQAGKGYRHSLICAIYNESAYAVATRKGGVGSADESLASALVAGRPFICLDNMRGRLDSQYLESLLTSPGEFAARVPYRGEIMVNPRSVLLQLSSNGLEGTRDLANRASICRILKREGFNYRDTLGEVQRRQAYYLGCVFAVVREWVARGKQRTSDTRHDFREWNHTLDWIAQCIFGAVPLMDGHQAAQERVGNPNLSWLRLVACAVEKQGELGQGRTSSEIVSVCERANIAVPGLKDFDPDKAKRHIGIIMRGLIGEKEAVSVEAYSVSRGERRYRKPSGDWDTTPEYTFSKTSSTQPPNSTQGI